MVDYSFYEALVAAAVAAFFVVLASVMLVRYRRLAQCLSSSSDLGKGLYESLEGRLKKQDERILDVMTRLDVIQAKMLEAGRRSEQYLWSVPPMVSQPRTPPVRSRPQGYGDESERVVGQPASSDLGAPLVQQEVGTSRPGPVGGAIYAPSVKPSKEPDSGEERALKLLNESPRTSVEIRDLTGLSREHAARIMKGLYDKGFVVRDDAHKPYRYELTSEGRKQVPPG
jgi:hypothetical protein